MPDYLTITCRLPAAAEEGLASALESWPVLGCEVKDRGRQLDVTVYLDEYRAASLPAVCEQLQVLGADRVNAGRFAGQDWLAAYRQRISAGPIGRSFWIDPHPETPTAAPSERIYLAIEPRQAFGTGSHESTQLALLLLEDMPVTGRRVLDVGTGSGILALAARALGADWVVGLDIDLEAAIIAGQTVREQRQPLPVALFAGTVTALRRVAAFDVVLANLLPGQAAPLLAHLNGLLVPEGMVIFSGVMLAEEAAVVAELAGADLAAIHRRELGEWVALVCQRR